MLTVIPGSIEELTHERLSKISGEIDEQIPKILVDLAGNQYIILMLI